MHLKQIDLPESLVASQMVRVKPSSSWSHYPSLPVGKDCFQEGVLVGQPPPHALNHVKDGSRLQEDNLQSSQDYSWMVNEGLLVPRRQNETGPDETPVLASSKSYLLQEDNLRSPRPGRQMVDEGQLLFQVLPFTGWPSLEAVLPYQQGKWPQLPLA